MIVDEDFDTDKFKKKLEAISQNFRKHMKEQDMSGLTSNPHTAEIAEIGGVTPVEEYVNQSLIEDRDML